MSNIMSDSFDAIMSFDDVVLMMTDCELRKCDTLRRSVFAYAEQHNILIDYATIPEPQTRRTVTIPPVKEPIGHPEGNRRRLW